MIETLTIEDFAPHVGEVFPIHFSDYPDIPLTLAEVTALRAGADTAQRAPFAVHWHGPAQPVLPQRIYQIAHPALGIMELFIVPLGPQAGSMVYEAIFN